jgi:hypothetical protein
MHLRHTFAFSERNTTMTTTDAVYDEIAQLLAATGIDLSSLPLVATPQQVSPVVNLSVGALAQDRYMKRGIPYVELGPRRPRYLKLDVARYLIKQRRGAD